ncbi:NAD-dependent epimerase/dehydratase family protein [Phytoactinopolyspora mesophila]|uniref:NAD-dependent epimerase/dehydratase family protein n=1 Tax=Phytoactinopolyspora mesophila TaxID=2650750 RepID=A0A7K3M7Q0_9ACTN|nr:NAD(P)-dependent oxidoreductase [Phytoactinopolyspora mesophila]NDL58418.1 NAD-dependent epimerase/dehydratase family protein [Phytoactinopolyspora mesophila]
MIIVTGGSGKAGRACVADLTEHGYDVTSVDLVPPADPTVRHTRVDLTDFGQAVSALGGIDERVSGVTGIVHLAAIPAPGLASNPVTFSVNTVSTYNVFEAARQLGIKNVVWASSETVLGLPFDVHPPYVPVDEEYPGRPESAYSLSKLLGEEMAKQFCRWDPELKIIGLRLSNVMEPDDYVRFADFQDEPGLRKWNLWSYIDARDAAQAMRLALESDITGAEVFVIANADSVMEAGNDDLLDAIYPDIPRKKALDSHETLLSIDKARRILGYEPRHGWRKPEHPPN